MEVCNQRRSIYVIFYAQRTLYLFKFYLNLFESNIILFRFPLKEKKNKVLDINIVNLSNLFIRWIGAAFSFAKKWELAVFPPSLKSGKLLVDFGS